MSCDHSNPGGASSQPAEGEDAGEGAAQPPVQAGPECDILRAVGRLWAPPCIYLFQHFPSEMLMNVHLYGEQIGEAASTALPS